MVAHATMAPSHWADLLDDLFLRVLDCFDFKERWLLGLAKLCASALNSFVKTHANKILLNNYRCRFGRQTYFRQ